ncbi:tyrosine-type recombinase/integrase [Oculatella sp. LEGE 06141]|uniref:tyrosine-type recombinase/integrase n=1 Tax=Oculatella sp. LEGE 06141 TaxID=1828648 RepID=UPI001881B168|nr:tyrosine-type recombinase/integrase [Oculatella sp. LEGE 06141]MBE9178697.1 tyrosine-type recombinase/integrase [Oculatella sp. LEGE 06141]
MSAIAPSSSSPFFLDLVEERDLIQELLADKRSESTRRTYARGLKDFFEVISGKEPDPALVAHFLQLERATAIKLVLHYKAQLIKRELSESTVNVRLSAIKSLVAFAQKVGKCVWSLEEIELEKTETYRDTTGITPEEFKLLFQVVDRSTLKGKRDYALLRLLWDNVLRRNEICSANVADFNPEAKTLAILGKGRGTQKESVSLSSAAVEALQVWLEARGDRAPKSPLFIAVDRAHFGQRLTGDGLYHLVRFQLAEKAGIKKRFSPHRCRHSGITAALDASNGNIRETMKLSRHRKPEVLMRYDDNRVNAQGKVTEMLADLMDV